MGKQTVDELIEFAGKHHAELLRTGQAYGRFNSKNGSILKLDQKFESTGKLIIVGAYQARTFMNQIDLEKRQI